MNVEVIISLVDFLATSPDSSLVLPSVLDLHDDDDDDDNALPALLNHHSLCVVAGHSEETGRLHQAIRWSGENGRTSCNDDFHLSQPVLRGFDVIFQLHQQRYKRGPWDP